MAAFPSVTPVCSASIATGAGPDRHQIPSMNWYHRDEERYVEYGTSFRASQAFGFKRSLTDTIYNMNARASVARDADGVRDARRRRRANRRHDVPDVPRTSPARGHQRDGPDADRVRGVQAAHHGSARVLLRGHVRVAADRMPIAARAAGFTRPARRMRGRISRRARPVRLPAALAAGQRHPLAQAWA